MDGTDVGAQALRGQGRFDDLLFPAGKEAVLNKAEQAGAERRQVRAWRDWAQQELAFAQQDRLASAR